MRNRAKCKLCKSIIESFHIHDYVTCSCGQISVDGGNNYFRAAALDWVNFIRVDDEGNEIIVKIKEKHEEPCINNDSLEEKTCTTIDASVNKPNKKELLEMPDSMIKNIEELPKQALTLPITHYDHLASLMLIKSFMETS